nr:hypothetical protein BaRGS_013304 [Batillaria attramentaria]
MADPGHNNRTSVIVNQASDEVNLGLGETNLTVSGNSNNRIIDLDKVAGSDQDRICPVSADRDRKTEDHSPVLGKGHLASDLDNPLVDLSNLESDKISQALAASSLMDDQRSLVWDKGRLDLETSSHLVHLSCQVSGKIFPVSDPRTRITKVKVLDKALQGLGSSNQAVANLSRVSDKVCLVLEIRTLQVRPSSLGLDKIFLDSANSNPTTCYNLVSDKDYLVLDRVHPTDQIPNQVAGSNLTIHYSLDSDKDCLVLGRVCQTDQIPNQVAGHLTTHCSLDSDKDCLVLDRVRLTDQTPNQVAGHLTTHCSLDSDKDCLVLDRVRLTDQTPNQVAGHLTTHCSLDSDKGCLVLDRVHLTDRVLHKADLPRGRKDQGLGHSSLDTPQARRVKTTLPRAGVLNKVVEETLSPCWDR